MLSPMIRKKASANADALISAPEKIRTPDTTVRSRMLYPAELLTHSFLLLAVFPLNEKYSTTYFRFCQHFLKFLFNFLFYRSRCAKTAQPRTAIMVQTIQFLCRITRSTISLPDRRFQICRKRIRICLSVQLFLPVCLCFFDQLRIQEKLSADISHDFRCRQHSLMGDR